MSPTGDLLVTFIFDNGGVLSRACSEATTCCTGIAQRQEQHTQLGYSFSVFAVCRAHPVLAVAGLSARRAAAGRLGLADRNDHYRRAVHCHRLIELLERSASRL